jgi:Zn-finger nucleic acid-binding protein
MLCPKDNVMCDVVMLQDVEVDVCPKCQGVWLEQVEVRKLVRHLTVPEYSTVDELLSEWEGAEHAGTLPRDFWAESKLICPKEGAQMQKHYFAGSDIGVDHCHVCKGFWLDGGELKAVASYVEPDVKEDELGRAVIRSWPLVRPGGVELWEAIPLCALALKNPLIGIGSIGSFLVRLFFDRMYRF